MNSIWLTFINFLVIGINMCNGADPAVDTSQYVEELPNGDIRPVEFFPALRKWDEEEPLDHINYSTDRIVGGRVAKISEVPYQVAIMARGTGIWCGGAIYNRDTVLSAAHCFASGAANRLVLVVGKTDLKSKEKFEQLSNVKSILIHSQYTRQPQLNDLAILKLQTPFCYNGHIQPIPIVKAGQMPTGKGVISGWGYTQARKSGESFDHSKSSRILKLTELDILAKPECIKRYEKNPGALALAEHESVFCAGSSKNNDNCQGDSGGPFACVDDSGTKYLCGLVSAGIGCGQPNTPAFYTDLSLPKFAEWIRENAGEPDDPCDGSDEDFSEQRKAKKHFVCLHGNATCWGNSDTAAILTTVALAALSIVYMF